MSGGEPDAPPGLEGRGPRPKRSSASLEFVAHHAYIIGPDYTLRDSHGSRAVGRGRCLSAGAWRPSATAHSSRPGVG
eukprot:9606604-Alexandrium_andersonii.AAC.1